MEVAINDTLAISYPRPATFFAFVCAVIFIVVGVIGNSITALALLRCPRLRAHATTTFVLSLCVSDLLFCSINLPLTASRYLHEEWRFGDALCQLFPLIFYGNVAGSLLSMVAITINRYILIAHYDKYSKLYSRTSILLQLIVIWCLAFGLMLPPLLGLWGKLGLDPETFSCTILMKDGHSPKKFFFLFGFVLPCLVIVISYSCIYWKVKKSKQKLVAHSELSIKETVRAAREREDTRLTTMMLTIFICFLLCFLPLMITNVADDGVSFPVFHVVASVLAWASSVVNPLIYAVSNRQYKTAYKMLFSPCKNKQKSRKATYESRTACHQSNSGNSHLEKKLQPNDSS